MVWYGVLGFGRSLFALGILIFVTGAAAAVRYGGKTWIKGLLALLAFIAGYAPWLGYLFHATDSVSNNWWMSEIIGLGECLQMLLCGPEFRKIVFCLLVLFLAVLFLTESAFFRMTRLVRSFQSICLRLQTGPMRLTQRPWVC